jgi:hypothetical protein
VLPAKYSWGDQIKEGEVRSVCLTYGGKEKCMQGCGEEHEGRRPLANHRHRWEDNIKMDLKEIEWNNMDWIHVVEECSKWQVLVSS